MATDQEDNSWMRELESALSNECYVTTVTDSSSNSLTTEYDDKYCANGAAVNANVTSDDDDLLELSDLARASIWQTCLLGTVKFDNRHDDVDDDSKNNPLLFDDIFDLPEQKILRQDCLKFVARLGNSEDDKISVMSDLESIVTRYCKCSGHQYDRSNGWMDLLLPLITLKLQPSDTYSLFEAILRRYVISSGSGQVNDAPFHLFRLLLLYHDPQLCSFLDTNKLTPQTYAKNWFDSLFASTCDLPVVLRLWDLYFQKADPFFIFFLSLVILINAKEVILSMSSKLEMIEFVQCLPRNLNVEDVSDFCALAEYYHMRTPSSFKRDLEESLFGWGGNGIRTSSSSDNSITTAMNDISQALCLPVDVDELIAATQTQYTTRNETTNDKRRQSHLDDSDNDHNPDTWSNNCVRFFLIDCRPAEQYNAGHPSTAFHLDCNLMLQDRNSFSTAVQGLLSCQRQALAIGSNAGGEHLCFLGSGNFQADQYTHMVVASFLQKSTPYVSMVTGGYKSFHAHQAYLQDHNAKHCLVCLDNHRRQHDVATDDNNDNNALSSAISSGSDHNRSSDSNDNTFGKLFSDIFGSVIKTKSAVEVKYKLYEHIMTSASSSMTIPNSQSSVNNNESVMATATHVNSLDRQAKRYYRNTSSVFSIDEHNEPSTSADGNRGGDSNCDNSHYYWWSDDQNHNGNASKLVKMSALFERPDVITSVKCQAVNMNNYVYDCYLVVGESALMVMRESNKSDYGYVTVNRPLNTILKITCKKKHPELVTFQYGQSSDVTDMDRFLIPNSNEVTKIISKQIREFVQKTTT